MSYHLTKITKFLNIQTECLDDSVMTFIITLELIQKTFILPKDDINMNNNRLLIMIILVFCMVSLCFDFYVTSVDAAGPKSRKS